jgi:N-acetylmuramoyl-L-alanine amidase
MTIKNQYSPNFSRKSRRNRDIKFIVIHYTGMQSKIASIKRLLSPRHKVSCHYLIDRKGQVLRMVDENKVAWHAGKSKWKNFKNLNKNSIGIELVNKGHELKYERFTNSQINELIKLCLNLKKKFKIKNSNILGHSDISPMRKQDPGEKFPWKKLKKSKLGIWYKPLNFKSQKINDKKINELFFKNLFKIGYRYFDLKRRRRKDVFLTRAFQRRFLPNKVTGIIDQKTYIISHFLANRHKN